MIVFGNGSAGLEALGPLRIVPRHARNIKGSSHPVQSVRPIPLRVRPAATRLDRDRIFDVPSSRRLAQRLETAAALRDVAAFAAVVVFATMLAVF